MPNINSTHFPVLTTERLTLRQLSIHDKEAVFALRSNDEVNKYLERQPSKTIEDAVQFIRKINENIQLNNSWYWAITLTGTNVFVGTICLFSFSNENESCEIGYELLPAYQGQGIMQEAVKKVIDYAFNTLQLKEITAFTHSGNKGSTNLLNKCNFTRSAEPDIENPDFISYSLTRYNW